MVIHAHLIQNKEIKETKSCKSIRDQSVSANLSNVKQSIARVYAQFQQLAGQVLGAVFEAQSINIALGDFKSTTLA